MKCSAPPRYVTGLRGPGCQSRALHCPPWGSPPAPPVTRATPHRPVVAVAAVAIILMIGDDASGPGQQALGPTETPRRSSTDTSAPQSIPPTASPTQVSVAALQTADGLTGLLQTLRDRFGDTMGHSLVVYPTHAVVDRVDPTNSNVQQDYPYRGDGWEAWGSPSSTGAFDDHFRVDAA